MSKESFSQKISEIMYKKLKAIEYYDSKTLLEYDENFEVAMCLAYMSLSKEKIIKKDMKNTDRLSRLTQKVDTSEIEKVFKPGFADQMPKIIKAKENNNLWILDNIRDSIMHGVCDIDEERKCFLINNDQYDRDLVAEVPFSWFIAYAKNDILSKKLSNHYTIKSFYYNKQKKNIKYLETQKELVNNILYRVDIKGNKFNVKDIENRINELFMQYSNEEITDDMVEKYEKEINKEKIKYNKKYLTSFYLAKEKVINEIQKEFSGINLKIFIDNRKYRFVNKESKKLPKYFNDYDLMFNMFNNGLMPKGISLLRYMSHIIENFDINKNIKDECRDKDNEIELIHKILTGVDISNNHGNNLSIIFDQDSKILKSIYLNIYGLSTLVINHETLYNPHFLNESPSVLGIFARQKKSYLEYATKQKSLIMQGLDFQIILFSKYDQLNKCKDDNAKKKIQTNIDNLEAKIKTIQHDLNNLATTLSFERVVRPEEVNYQKKHQIDEYINQYFGHFNSVKDVELKKKIRKIIGKLFDMKIEEEAKYTYGYCSNVQDVLTIIRNSFSHIGRIYIGKNNGLETTVILNDYDTNGEKSGEVICKYIDLIRLLENPYQSLEQKQNNM